MARRLFRNYAKRNSVQAYLQSHGAIGARLVHVFFEYSQLPKSQSSNYDEALFWLYTALREDILPINYFNQYLEADVLSKTFDFIFKHIDPEMSAIFGDIPRLVFIRHFINLFTEFPNPCIQYAVLDMLFAFGSGYTTSTSTD